MTLPYSDAIFVVAFPRECTEAFLEGHLRAFAFFGGVPRRISYDNSRIAVTRITSPRDRKLTDAFLRMKSHHLFQEHFCPVPEGPKTYRAKPARPIPPWGGTGQERR